MWIVSTGAGSGHEVEVYKVVKSLVLWYIKVQSNHLWVSLFHPNRWKKGNFDYNGLNGKIRGTFD